MQEEEESKTSEVNADALEAVFVGEEVIIEEEEVFVVAEVEEEEDDVDLAFQEDEGYW